ncbi:hypothetical protein EV421DRAFT_1907442 [Armillaria borealis]|uniref:Uncharacterized protein n=1 Tax=Armillaria borealis TaxID=47425 RepID=A0AA39MK99_9AGAR|nr:hypothetical protein EV421DRAFT_1907442 [Armillaria borealis]
MCPCWEDVLVVERDELALQDILYAGDKLLKDFPHYHSILVKDWSSDEDSYVVLVACKAYQFAMERWVDGVEVGIFTHLLLCLLGSSYCNAEMTYEGLLHAFDRSLHQTPVVARKHREVPASAAYIWLSKMCQPHMAIRQSD